MIAALLVAAALVAQDPQDTVILQPVVVTATRVPTPTAAVTAAVTVISGASLRERGILTVADALRQTVGASVVQTAGPGSQTSLFLRGGESDYVKILVDGVALNQPGGAYNLAHLTTDDVDRIEIVRGPTSVLYGSDALAGVIQIFTRAGLGAPRVLVEAGAGEFGARRGAVTLTGRTGRGIVSYSLSGSRYQSHGLYDVNSDDRNDVLTGQVRVVPDDRSDGAVTVRHGAGDFHYPTDGAGRVVDANQHATDRGPAIALDFGRRLSPQLEVRALLGLTEGDGRLIDDPDGPADTAGVFAFRSHDRVRRRSADLRVNWRNSPASGTVVTGGVALEDARLRSSNVCQSSFGDCSGAPIDTTRSSRGLFVQWLGGVGRPVSFNLGGRIEDNQQFGRFVTWRGGVAWRLDAATRLRAAAGTGFKEPTFFENFATGFVIGNPDLHPERSASWEAGIEHTPPGTDLTMAVTYFDQRFRDLIVYDFTRTPNYVNVAAAAASGAEVQLDYVVQRAVVASVNYTYLETRVLNGGGDPSFETGKRLLRRPTNAATVTLAYHAPRRGTATLALRFAGDRDDLDFAAFPAPRVTLHPYTRVNAGLEYPVGGGLTLTAQAENLTGDRGREIANFPVRGRALFFGGRFTGALTR